MAALKDLSKDELITRRLAFDREINGRALTVHRIAMRAFIGMSQADKDAAKSELLFMQFVV